MIMEICRSFDGIFKEHLDGMYVSQRVLLYSSMLSVLDGNCFFYLVMTFLAADLVVIKCTTSLTINYLLH